MRSADMEHVTVRSWIESVSQENDLVEFKGHYGGNLGELRYIAEECRPSAEDHKCRVVSPRTEFVMTHASRRPIRRMHTYKHDSTNNL